MSVKVSVIIPTYNRPALLNRCLEALVLQDFLKNNYEIIVVTDGPDEQTGNVVKTCAENHADLHISCHSLLIKRGPAAARNTGWKMAKGELILFTDDDCLPSTDWIKNYYNAFQFYAQSLIAFTGRIIVPRPVRPTDFELNTAHLETADFVTANCACTRAALETVNGFDEAFTMAWREDSDLEFRLYKGNIPVKRIEEAEIVHPVRKAPWGVSLKEQKKSMFNALLFKKHPQLYKERIHTSALWNYFFMIILFIAFLIAFSFGQKIVALALFFCWFILLALFIYKRLAHTSHSFKHITEMIATSICIPFFSAYWNLYGAYKFKALHLWMN